MRRLPFFIAFLIAVDLSAAAAQSLDLTPAEAPALRLPLDTSETADLRLAQVIETDAEKVKPDIHYVPTPQRLVDVMLLMARVNKDDLLYDLGSGDGRLVITAAKTYGARGIGIDIDPQRIKEAKENAAAAGVEDKVEFRQQDLFKTDFKDASVITLYLLDTLNRRLRPQIFAQVKPGTRIVSHAFSMGDWEPDAQRTLKIKNSEYDAFFWVVPANMSGRWKISADPKPAWMPETVLVEQTFQNFVVRGPDGGEPIGKGNLDAHDFVLTIDKGPRGKPVGFTGRVDGNSLTARPSGSGRTLTAAREPGTEKPVDPGDEPR